MKSLLTRLTSRPFFLVGVIGAIIVLLLFFWWLSSQNSDPLEKTIVPSSVTTQEIALTPVPTVTTSAPIASEVAPTLQTDPAIAAEVLDRLNDEQTRLQERQQDLAKQLEMSNKLIALKEKQIESMLKPEQ